MPKSKKTIKVRDQQPRQDVKGGGRHHVVNSGGGGGAGKTNRRHIAPN